MIQELFVWLVMVMLYLLPNKPSYTNHLMLTELQPKNRNTAPVPC
jgi:hypothetical protein